MHAKAQHVTSTVKWTFQWKRQNTNHNWSEQIPYKTRIIRKVFFWKNFYNLFNENCMQKHPLPNGKFRVFECVFMEIVQLLYFNVASGTTQSLDQTSKLQLLAFNFTTNIRQSTLSCQKLSIRNTLQLKIVCLIFTTISRKQFLYNSNNSDFKAIAICSTTNTV